VRIVYDYRNKIFRVGRLWGWGVFVGAKRKTETREQNTLKKKH
jgi:hypothetical protein